MLNEAKINETLMLASWKGHTETVKALLDAGADVHTHEDHALRWASEKGHTQTVKALLAAGADAHAGKDRALRRASENGHTETVKALLDAGADVHAHEDDALRRASQNGHTKTATLLREAMKAAPAPEAVSRLQQQFKARAGKELTRTEAMTAFRIVRALDAAKPSAL